MYESESNKNEGREENPYQPPDAKPVPPILWDSSTLVQVGFILHSIVLGIYMLVTVREDVPPRVAVMQVPLWLDQMLFVLNAAACILVVLPTLAKENWPWTWKLAVLWFELTIVILIVFASHNFGELLAPFVRL